MQKSVLVAVSRWKFFHKYKLRRRWTKKYMVRPVAVAKVLCCVLQNRCSQHCSRSQSQEPEQAQRAAGA